MRYHLRLGASFFAIAAEFSSDEVKEIRALAKSKIHEITSCGEFERDGARVSRLVFDEHDYGFVLVRSGKWEWTLEVAETPPHAKPGQRIKAARRKREREERKQARRANQRSVLALAQASVERMLFKSYELLTQVDLVLNQACLNLFALLDDVEPASAKLRFTVREQLLRMAGPSCEACRRARIAPWFEGAAVLTASGLRWELRWFGVELGLPMLLYTRARIEVEFVLGGVSIFGEQALESEWVT